MKSPIYKLMKECDKMSIQSVGTHDVKQGLTIVITGNGKGKTTSAFGQALRAVGHGYDVCIIQFMKGRKYGENIAAEKYLPTLKVIQCGLDSFVKKGNPSDIDVKLAKEGMKKAREIIQSRKYYMVILDEINVAIDFNVVPEDEVLDLVKNKPPELNLILTGRYAPKSIREIADTVSDIQEVKHHYYAGVKSQAGIEY